MSYYDFPHTIFSDNKQDKDIFEMMLSQIFNSEVFRGMIDEAIIKEIENFKTSGDLDKYFYRIMEVAKNMPIVIDKPLFYPYADILFNGKYFSAQGLVKYNDYFFCINAHTGNDAEASEKGIDLIVLSKTFKPITHFIIEKIGHCNGSAIDGGNLLLIGDSNAYKNNLFVIPIISILNGKPEIKKYTLPEVYYSVSVANNTIYLCNGYKVDILASGDYTGKPTHLCDLQNMVNQSIYVIGNNMFGFKWKEYANRNVIYQFDLLSGALLHSILLPANLGREFSEIQGMCNMGTEADPNLLIYFNSDSNLKPVKVSNYVLRCQFIASDTDVIDAWKNEPVLPYPFENRDHGCYYQPSYHGIMYGTKAEPFNCESQLQYFLNYPQYNYIHITENVDSLTIKDAKYQLMLIPEGDYTINNLNLYYCDIVDMLVKVNKLTAYKVRVLDLANLDNNHKISVGDINASYVDKLAVYVPVTSFSYLRFSHITSTRDDLNVGNDSINCTLDWVVNSDNVDALKNIVNGRVFVDNYGPNGLPVSDRGVVDIAIRNNNGTADFGYATFTDVNGKRWINGLYRNRNQTRDWTKSGWKLITTTNV